LLSVTCVREAQDSPSLPKRLRSPDEEIVAKLAVSKIGDSMEMKIVRRSIVVLIEHSIAIVFVGDAEPHVTAAQ
jgi:hypothetical protein